MTQPKNPEPPQVTFPTSPPWRPVAAFFEQLKGEKRSPQAKKTLSRLGWAIVTLSSTGAPITAAAIGKLCADAWGGPKPQSIANDASGYARLVSLAKAAQVQPGEARSAETRTNHLLARVADPMTRAEVQLLLAEVGALRSQLATLRAGLRRVEALGPITAGLAQYRIENLEELAERLKHSRQPSGLTFSDQERTAVQAFLDGLDGEGFTTNLATGEIFGRTGRRIAKPGFLQALSKLVRDHDMAPDTLS